MIKLVHPSRIVGEGLTILSGDVVQESERQCLEQLGRKDFHKILKAVRGNPEAEAWARTHKNVWLK